MSRISDKHTLSCGSTIWIQRIKNRKYAVVECTPSLFDPPEIQWFKSKAIALDAIADRLQADVTEAY